MHAVPRYFRKHVPQGQKAKNKMNEKTPPSRYGIPDNMSPMQSKVEIHGFVILQ